MTDVRRTGPPRRLENRTRSGIPIEGEVDGIWQRAFHAEVVAEVQRRPVRARRHHRRNCNCSWVFTVCHRSSPR
jgi:hypothetical protein